jgi:glycosyltransferase involved in cell wall biosynthesis
MKINFNKGSKVIFTYAIDYDNRSGDFYHPLVSFVIPVLNSERTLEKCIESIVRQNYPKIEILLIDSGSFDSSLNIAKRFGAKIYHFIGPLGDVRNFGINNSSGELIALWDSDIYILEQGWLSQSVSTINKFPMASTLWIRTMPPPDAGIVAKAYDWFSWTVMLTLAQKGFGFWGGGISIFKRRMIEEVGGIMKGVDTGEDYDLARKLAMKGYKTVFYNNPVYHDSHNTLTELIRKDLRRATNFKKIGLSFLTGIPLYELVIINFRVGFLLSLKNLFIKKEIHFAMVPILLLIRIMVYAISWITR